MEETYDLGIDVSKWQGDIDYQKVKAFGIKFGIAKATEGSDIKDDKFLQNWQGMKTVGIKASAYHYLRGGDPSSSQAMNICSTLSKCCFDKNNDILAIDVEESRNENITPDVMAHTLKSLLELLKDFKHIYVYCSPWYWENKIAFKNYDFSNCGLWIADWGGRKEPRIPETWCAKGYIWWQYSSKGSVDGINGFVDLNRSRKCQV